MFGNDLLSRILFICPCIRAIHLKSSFYNRLCGAGWHHFDLSVAGTSRGRAMQIDFRCAKVHRFWQVEVRRIIYLHVCFDVHYGRSNIIEIHQDSKYACHIIYDIFGSVFMSEPFRLQCMTHSRMTWRKQLSSLANGSLRSLTKLPKTSWRLGKAHECTRVIVIG